MTNRHYYLSALIIRYVRHDKVVNIYLSVCQKAQLCRIDSTTCQYILSRNKRRNRLVYAFIITGYTKRGTSMWWHVYAASRLCGVAFMWRKV